MPQDFSRWASRNKCQVCEFEELSALALDSRCAVCVGLCVLQGNPVQTYKNGPYSNQVYQNCSQLATLELMKHDGELACSCAGCSMSGLGADPGACVLVCSCRRLARVAS